MNVEDAIEVNLTGDVAAVTHIVEQFRLEVIARWDVGDINVRIPNEQVDAVRETCEALSIEWKMI